MVKVISTLDPLNEIFNKDYCRPRISDETQLMVDNPHGYFDGLPLTTQSSKRKISLVSSSAKMTQHLAITEKKLEYKMRKV